MGCGKVDRRADVTRTQIELVGQGGHRMLGLPVCGGGGIAAVGTAASAASRRAIPLHDTGMLHGVQPLGWGRICPLVIRCQSQNQWLKDRSLVHLVRPGQRERHCAAITSI